MKPLLSLESSHEGMSVRLAMSAAVRASFCFIRMCVIVLLVQK